MPQYPSKNYFLLGLLCLTSLCLIQCGSGGGSASSSSGSSNLPDPTAAVVSQVGSTNDVIVTDSIQFLSNLASGSDYDLETVISANVGAQIDPTGGHFIIRPLAAADSNDRDIETTVSYDETVNCSISGTKHLQGDLDLVVGFNTGSGSLSGNYFVTYDNCEESVHLTTSTSPCDIETMINGTVSNAVTINFSDLEEFNPDRYESSDAVSVSGMTFAINQGATKSVAFDFNIYDNSLYSSPEVSGTVTFASTTYDVVGMQDFIAATSDTQVCP